MIRHVAGFAEIVDDVGAAVRFYRDVLGLVVEYDEGGEHARVKVPGVLYFGIWSRRAAAEATFGDANSLEMIPIGFLVSFEVDSVEAAAERIAERGLRLAQGPKQEEWGQRTARFFLPSGSPAEVVETPWARRIGQDLQAQGE